MQQQQEPGHQTLALRGTDAAAALVPKVALFPLLSCTIYQSLTSPS